MNILIIGTGNMARGISTRLLAGGHHVKLYNPDHADAEQLADELRGTYPDSGKVSVAAELPGVISASEVVILASWYAVNLETARDQADALDGKVVVDISNPLNDTYDALVTEGGLSAAETIQAVLPAGAKVVKAFNTTFAGTLVDGEVSGQTLDVFIAGDDETARHRVAKLATDGGLNAVEVGGLERARQLEALGLLGITLQSRLDTGFMTAWKLVLPQVG
ncbi:MAG TPA: NAD(P)-binding domain-containing protein [Gemmatimonadota bacterium]|nr:NAD(P)-binding domain-containing protein [Gemmatimonadota bacterium]